MVYVTPDVMPNPYDRLPEDSAWSALVGRVEEYRSGKVAVPALKGVPVVAAAASPTTRAAATTRTTVKKTVTTKKR